MKKITPHLVKKLFSRKSPQKSYNEKRIVKLDLNSPLTQERIIEQINKCGNIKTERA